MNATNNIATDLFFKIRSRFQGLKLGDEMGQITINPEDARFFDGQTGDQIYETFLNILPETTYFVWPSSIIFHKINEFKKFRVEVTLNKQIIHNEFIHI